MFSITVHNTDLQTVLKELIEPAGSSLAEFQHSPWFEHIHSWYVINEHKSRVYGFTLKPSCPDECRPTDDVYIQDLYLVGRAESATDD